jgi:hypothetical protein
MLPQFSDGHDITPFMPDFASVGDISTEIRVAIIAK